MSDDMVQDPALFELSALRALNAVFLSRLSEIRATEVTRESHAEVTQIRDRSREIDVRLGEIERELHQSELELGLLEDS